ncbi:thiamine-phosphate synthase family protein [Methanocaldococcus indicus]|uniref:thiamine-phosphate synthase family protein n=1 Tax=Methanocaldococcus indicus TaxID=213231 RepID=UPI003C6D8DA3
MLIIAGYDPSGGAGVLADLKVCRELNINPRVVTTSIIPQNNLKVYEKYDLPIENIENQLKSIFEEYYIKWVKVGVVSGECIDLIVEYIKKYDLKVILDPVLESSTKYKFIENLDKYLELINSSYLITPNEKEYRVLKDYLSDYKNYILITGINDKLIKNNELIKEFYGVKLDRDVHGTGCVYSTAITSFLFLGYNLFESIEEAKKLAISSVIYAEKTKFGYNSNPKHINKEKILKNLYYALEYLRKINFSLIPEIGSNLAECLILPKSYEDIASLTGRIVKNKEEENKFYVCGRFKFGIRGHVSRLVLSANKINPSIRAGMNIKYSEELIEKLEDKFKVSYFDRKKEPKNVSTMEWGIKEALSRNKDADIVYDTGDIGKEPIIRVLGKDILEVVKKVEIIEDIYKKI